MLLANDVPSRRRVPTSAEGDPAEPFELGEPGEPRQTEETGEKVGRSSLLVVELSARPESERMSPLSADVCISSLFSFASA